MSDILWIYYIPPHGTEYRSKSRKLQYSQQQVRNVISISFYTSANRWRVNMQFPFYEVDLNQGIICSSEMNNAISSIKLWPGLSSKKLKRKVRILKIAWLPIWFSFGRKPCKVLSVGIFSHRIRPYFMPPEVWRDIAGIKASSSGRSRSGLNEPSRILGQS